jgi:hypothetical protein
MEYSSGNCTMYFIGLHGHGTSALPSSNGATTHTVTIEICENRLHGGWFHPIIGRTCVCFISRTDECAIFHASNIGWIRCTPEGVGLLLQSNKGARSHQLSCDAFPLCLRTIAPIDPIGLRKFCNFLNPSRKALMNSR